MNLLTQIRKKTRIILAIAIVFCNAIQISKADDPLTSPRTKWFRDARVGIIVHWGLYSIPAGEWKGVQVPWYGEWIENKAPISATDYANLATQFNPVSFDARQWIGTIKEAGFKYFCLVTKHHDGFSLWDTQQNNNWNVMDATPFKRDIVKELSDACLDSSIRYALYYSSGLDWHFPSINWSNYKTYYYKQLKELLTNYGKIGYLWFDGEWTPQWNDQEATDLENYVHSLDPDVLTNNPKQKSSSAYGDFGIDEENYSPDVSAFNNGLWERDRLVQYNTWGYKSWEPWKSPVDLIRDMIDAASNSMNFCLNIGPKADGTFPSQAINTLKEFGKWLNVNGEAIYGTTGFVKNISVNNDSRITSKDTTTFYVHVTDWNTTPLIITTPIAITNVAFLDPSISSTGLNISTDKGVTTITVNKPANTDIYATVLKLEKSDCNIPITGVSINPDSLSVGVNNTQQAIAMVSPPNACHNISWSSSDTSIAKVNNNGVISGISEGNVIIKATTIDSAKTATTKVSVHIIPVTGVQVSPATVSMGLGSTFSLSATFSPTNASNKNVSWESSDTLIASVNKSGLVSGMSLGNVNIIVKTIDGNKTDTCKIIVDKRGGGIKGEYYNSLDLTGNVALERIDTTIDFDWGSSTYAGNQPVDNFSVRWTGQVLPKYSQTYTFEAESDDGARLWVNGKKLIDNWVIEAPTKKSGTINLIKDSKYNIKLEYFENGGGASVHLRWSSATQPYGIIPQWNLYNSYSIISVAEVKIQPDSLALNIGKKATLNAVLLPDSATEQTVSWESDNPLIATIDKNTGLVNAISKGVANISVTTKDGNKTATCSVTVNKPNSIDKVSIENQYFIFPNPVTHNSFTIAGLSGNENILIYDLLGKLIYRCKNLKSKSMLINNLNLHEGVYMIRIENNEIVDSMKMVVYE